MRKKKNGRTGRFVMWSLPAVRRIVFSLFRPGAMFRVYRNRIGGWPDPVNHTMARPHWRHMGTRAMRQLLNSPVQSVFAEAPKIVASFVKSPVVKIAHGKKYYHFGMNRNAVERRFRIFRTGVHPKVGKKKRNAEKKYDCVSRVRRFSGSTIQARTFRL